MAMMPNFPPLLCRDCLYTGYAPPGSCPACGSPRTLAHADLPRLAIAHIDCDAFYASVEKRDRPDLRNKPLIVGHPGGRGVVTTACYIARKFGPRSAMPMFKALEMCPQAVVIPPSMAKYKQVSAQIRALFLAATPLVEPVSLDEAYLDLSAHIRSDPRPPAVLLAEMAAAIERDIGVTVSVGLSCNKFLAKLASDMNKPRGFSVIGPDEARAMLAPMAVGRIHGVGAATAQRMNALGIATIGQLQRMPEAELMRLFGKFGRALAWFSHGQDPRRVTPDRPAKSISAETTFPRDTRSVDDLDAALQSLSERVAARLQHGGMAGHTVVLKLKTSDFRSLTRNHRLPHATQRAKIIHGHALALAAREADGRAFRLVGVGVGDLDSAEKADPPDLFGGMV